MEEENDEQRCHVIYYCASSSDHDIAALYHNHAPPTVAAETDKAHNDRSLDLIYRNVRILLDEDQGGFHSVYISSSKQQCLDRLDVYANTLPTVVIVEVEQPSTSELLDTQHIPHSKPSDGTAFLHVLKHSIQGARYQNDVLLFALVVSSTTPDLDAATTAHLLSAGAVDISSSPILTKAVGRLVGHMMDRTRPPARLVGSSMAQNLVNSIRENSTTGTPCHRPDQSLSKERLRFVEDAVAQWAFPAHELDLDELIYAAVLMLEHVLRDEKMESYRLDRAEIVTFVLATRRQYKHEREVHYHNWRHAVDVTQSVYQFLLAIGLCPPADAEEAAKKVRSSVERLLTPLDGLMLLVSAIGHDVGHPGVNNAFLVACNHPLAQMYNDKSVLENYHCAAYSQLLRRHWPSLSKCPSFRQTLISNILATDMQRHFEYMSHLTELRARLLESNMSIEHWSEKETSHARELMMALMMKAADISNIARPFDISVQWAKILINEFASQGALEAELDIPTCLFGGPPDKEDVLAAAQSQKGFMNLFGFPLFQGLSDMIPSVSCSVDTLEQNQRKWDERIADEIENRKNRDAGHATFASLGTAHETEMVRRHRQSEPAIVPVRGDVSPSTPIRCRSGDEQSGTPVRHSPTDERKRYTTGYSWRDDGKRSSTTATGPNSLHVALGTAASRRSSKDVALDQLHQLSLFAQQSLAPSSRRGSTEGSYQYNQSLSPSRRGSRDESLTTILVTSQRNSARGSHSNGSPSGNAEHSPSKDDNANGHRSNGSPARHNGRQAGHRSTRKDTGNSIPSSHSHAASSATADTQHSPSTQPSSVAAVDGETSPTIPPLSITHSAGDDPFIEPSLQSSQAESAATTPGAEAPPMQSSREHDTFPYMTSHDTSGDGNENNARKTSSKSEPGSLRESRSRSRLGSLKFWKKNKKDAGTDAGRESIWSSP